MSEGDPFRVFSEGIDDDMKRLSWLCWAIEDETKPPKRSDDPTQYADSSDATTWGPFTDALATADGRDLGVGLSFAQPSPFVAIDIDVPESSEWVPDLDRLGGAVVERSPSENFRVYLRDVSVPEWWTNLGEPGKNTREVKLFDDSGYVTVTGDVLDGHAPPIGETSQVAFEQWLKEAWRAFADEGDREPWIEPEGVSDDRSGDQPLSTSTSGSGDELNEERARDALRHVDPDAHYDTWRNIGFALADEFDRATARSLFEEWSRRGSKYKDNAEGQAAGIVDDADPAGASGVTIGTLIHHAVAGGWSPGRPSRPSTGSEDAGEDDEGDEQRNTPREFDVRAGEYGVTRTVGEGDDERQVWDQWTNFEIEAVEFLHERGDGDVRATLRVQPATGEDAYEVTVPMTVFNDPRTFRAEVVIGRTTTFEAGGSELNALRRFVGGQDAPRRIAVDQVGLFGLGSDERTEFVVPNGSITADGWADDPAYAWDAPENAVSALWDLDPEDGDETDREAVAEALRLLPRSRLPDRLLPVLGWFYAAPLRPHMMRWEGEANQLSVTGDTGAGKTTTLEHFSRLFGGSGEVLSASSSYFSLMMNFASSNAFPVVIDEYKPADMNPSKLDAFHEYLRKSTRGANETRGNTDMGVDTYPLRSPVAIAGEQAVSGPAEERRLVSTNFSKRATARHSTSREAFARLAGLTYEDESGTVEHFDGVDHRHHALAYYRFITGLDADELLAAWKRAGERVRDVLTDLGGPAEDVKDAEARALQTVAFGIGTYRAFADEYDVNASEAGVTDEATASALRYLVTDGRGADDYRAKRASHVDRLLGLLARAAYADGYLEEGRHYAFVHEGKAKELLCIKLEVAFDGVRRYARDHDVAGEDLLDADRDYRARLRDEAETDGGLVADTSKVTGDLGRSVAIHVGRAMATVEGFDRDMFGDRKPNEHVAAGVDPEHMAEAIAAANGKLDQAEHSQDERVKCIREALTALADRDSDQGPQPGVTRDEIAAHVEDEHGIGRDKTHARLNQMLRDGDAFEGDGGRLYPMSR